MPAYTVGHPVDNYQMGVVFEYSPAYTDAAIRPRAMAVRKG